MEEGVLECNGDLKEVQELNVWTTDVNGQCGDEGSQLIAAIKNGDKQTALELADPNSKGALTDVHAQDLWGNTALHWACEMGMEKVVQLLISDPECQVDRPYGCWRIPTLMKPSSRFLHVPSVLTSANFETTSKLTPLMDAVCYGHDDIVKLLLMAGANPDLQNELGDTALHLAAFHNQIQCGILLVEGGACVKTKNMDSNTPLHIAKSEFKEAIMETLSFTTRKTLCVIGDAECGKSTLIAALQAKPSNSFLGKIVNWRKRVNDSHKRTAGIETIPHCSERYGEVLFYDFAGQHEYHGPHQIFLESFLGKPGVSVTFLLVVKATEEEAVILNQFRRWLFPIAQLASSASPPQVIVVGSFVDKVKSKQEATAKLNRCIEVVRKDFSPVEFVNVRVLDCRQPHSTGIDQLCRCLKDIPIPEFRATHTRYSLAWVLSRIKSSFKSRAVQLQEFSAWIQDNKDKLPQTLPSPEEVCQDLSAAGQALYLSKKEDPPKGWLVLDLPSILNDVYGTLFSQSRGIINEFGLLHYRDLAKLFPDLDVEIVQQLLISLEFCIPVDPSVLKAEVSTLMQSKEASGWLFFPALISAKRPQTGPPQQGVRYLCWQLRTSKRYSISIHVLQKILLHLAAHFHPFHMDCNRVEPGSTETGFDPV